MTMPDRRTTMTQWIERGRYVVGVDVEVVYMDEDPGDPVIEPATVKRLAEIARRAEAGDVEYLKSVGRVYESVQA
jgi:hypothetical protein